jgi:6-phosphogluconolactonase
MQPIVEIKKDADAVANTAAQLMLDLVQDSAGIDASTAICLSGGSTPRLLYQELAAPPISQEFPWEKIHWFWGDERYVLQDNALSNYRMVNDAMFAHVPVPATNIHRIRTELPTPQAAAQDYESELQRYYKQLQKEHPLFLITLLGLGTDGHTASLFPGTAALKERTLWVTAVEGVKEEARITLTYPVLNNSQHVIFLVTGTDKREILKRFLARDEELPAVHVASVGQLHVFADEAAAG